MNKVYLIPPNSFSARVRKCALYKVLLIYSLVRLLYQRLTLKVLSEPGLVLPTVLFQNSLCFCDVIRF